MKYIEIKTNIDDLNKAKIISNRLLEKHLIASSNIIQVESIYNRNNKQQEYKEYMIIMKTTIYLYKKIEEEILNLHTYELPEISYHEITGHEKYLKWIDDETKQIKEI